MRHAKALDGAIATLDPQHRIEELQRENAALRHQVDRLIALVTNEEAADGFALELVGRGIRAPEGLRFTADGWTAD